VGLSSTCLRPYQAIGATFRFLPGAVLGIRNARTVAELKATPGPKLLRMILERGFVDFMPQYQSIKQVMREFPFDVIGDHLMLGVLPMLLGPQSKRPR
jgi:hypothetical protein